MAATLDLGNPFWDTESHPPVAQSKPPPLQPPCCHLSPIASPPKVPPVDSFLSPIPQPVSSEPQPERLESPRPFGADAMWITHPAADLEPDLEPAADTLVERDLTMRLRTKLIGIVR